MAVYNSPSQKHKPPFSMVDATTGTNQSSSAFPGTVPFTLRLEPETDIPVAWEVIPPPDNTPSTDPDGGFGPWLSASATPLPAPGARFNNRLQLSCGSPQFPGTYYYKLKATNQITGEYRVSMMQFVIEVE